MGQSSARKGLTNIVDNSVPDLYALLVPSAEPQKPSISNQLGKIVCHWRHHIDATLRVRPLPAVNFKRIDLPALHVHNLQHTEFQE